MRIDAAPNIQLASISLSIEMLRAVVGGDTYEAVATRHGISRTAVERRIKAVAVQLTHGVGVAGLNEDGAAFVRRLRQHRDAILLALEEFNPEPASTERPARVMSVAEVDLGAVRIKGRTARTWHDLSLYHLLFATGLRPLEVARLTVDDYLLGDGSIHRESAVRPDVAINGKARPLHFRNRKLDDAFAIYLEERRQQGHGIGSACAWRGLDPHSRLFMGPTGEPYAISINGESGQNRFVCRAVLETYRKLFRYADIEGLCSQSARLTLMSRMYERGADEDQVGLILGIADRSAVRGQLPRPRPSLSRLLDELG